MSRDPVSIHRRRTMIQAVVVIVIVAVALFLILRALMIA
jgi:hypothetical protein